MGSKASILKVLILRSLAGFDSSGSMLPQLPGIEPLHLTALPKLYIASPKHQNIGSN